MSVENLATVFGPSLLHGGNGNNQRGSRLTVDFMSQRAVVEFFIRNYRQMSF